MERVAEEKLEIALLGVEPLARDQADRERHERESRERRRQPKRATETGLALGDHFRRSTPRRDRDDLTRRCP
jgi:hypothetical protein